MLRVQMFQLPPRSAHIHFRASPIGNPYRHWRLGRTYKGPRPKDVISKMCTERKCVAPRPTSSIHSPNKSPTNPSSSPPLPLGPHQRPHSSPNHLSTPWRRTKRPRSRTCPEKRRRGDRALLPPPTKRHIRRRRPRFSTRAVGRSRVGEHRLGLHALPRWAAALSWQ